MVIALDRPQQAAPPVRARRAAASAPHVGGAAVAGGRDTGIDLVRALCVVIVVLLHALMAGVMVDGTGPLFINAAEGAAWFAPLTWVAQIMPLFFVIGGFAGSIAYDRARVRGGSASGFIAARVHRLLLPAVLVLSVVGAALVSLLIVGVPAELVGVAGFRYSQPLWFLGVFLLCQALLPALLAVHHRAPLRGILTLAAAAVLIDVLRAGTGLDALGFLNLAFVWLALQQLGFFLADGRIDALRPGARVGAAITAIGALAALCVAGVYSPDLIENLNPPTAALLLVGVAQTAALSLLRGRLDRLSRRPGVAAFTAFVTARTMTIYLWHMVVVLGMAGVTALVAMHTGMALPVPSSLEWWLTRPLWLAGVVLLTAGAAWLLSGAERVRLPAGSRLAARVVQSVLCGLVGIVGVLAATGSALSVAVGVALLLVALARIRPGTAAA